MKICTFRKVKKWFDNGNVMVTGCKGTGKDVIFGNVIARSKKPYISNLDYTNDGRRFPLNLSALDCGENTFKEFLSGDVYQYTFPYPDGTDVYISDAGTYFPAQYCGILDRDYSYFPQEFALSRQLGNMNIHTNAQAYERVWNKLREQAQDVFLRCRWCKVMFNGKFVIGAFTFYDKAKACEERIRPCRYKLPLLSSLNANRRQKRDLYLDDFYNKNGTVKDYIYFGFNKSKHNDRYFRVMLSNGKEKK